MQNVSGPIVLSKRSQLFLSLLYLLHFSELKYLYNFLHIYYVHFFPTAHFGIAYQMIHGPSANETAPIFRELFCRSF